MNELFYSKNPRKIHLKTVKKFKWYTLKIFRLNFSFFEQQTKNLHGFEKNKKQCKKHWQKL